MKKLLWLLSLSPPLLSVVTIRSYLGFFDNASLFTENLSVLGIFNFVFIFMFLVTGSFAIIFFAPSAIFSCFFITSFRKEHNHKDIRMRVSLATIICITFSVFSFFSWAYLADRFHLHEKLIGWSFLLASISLIFLINYLLLKATVKIAQEYQGSKERRKTALMSYFFAPALITFIVALFFAFSFAMIFGWVNTKMAGDSIEMLFKIALLVSGIGIVSLFPGMVYVCTDADLKNSSWYYKFGFITVLAWPLITGMYVPSFYPVLVDKTIALAGISDWKSRSFQIEDKKFPPELFTRAEWKTETVKKGEFFKVRGIMVYSINGIKLLCPESIREPYKAMLRFVPWDHEYDKKMNTELKSAASYCQPFPRGGVSRLSDQA